jgi:putative tryptophan/tyrosine transport system substrate-binding protein
MMSAPEGKADPPVAATDFGARQTAICSMRISVPFKLVDFADKMLSFDLGGAGMNRRTFITLIGGAAASPLVARAQQPAKMKRLAMANPAIKTDDMRIGGDPGLTIFFEELKRLGYVEGLNLKVERYSGEGHLDRLPEIAREVVATRPDVIAAVSNILTLALKSETRTIPIVAWTSDPVVNGIIPGSLARPGGNITGLSIAAGPEFAVKRLQSLVEAVGKLTNARALATPAAWAAPSYKPLKDAAERMNIPLPLEPLQSPVNEAEYTRAFKAMQLNHVDGVLIDPSPEAYTHSQLLGRLAQQYRLPTITYSTETTEAGALMSYAFDWRAGSRRLAALVVEVLNGGNPAEIPYFQETHWELVINLKAAKELGLEIPAGLVAQADRVIE